MAIINGFINLFIFLMILGVCATAFGSVENMNELIEETQLQHGHTEARLINGIEENETIRGFYANKKLVEFVLEAHPSKIKLALVPSQQRKSKQDFPKTSN